VSARGPIAALVLRAALACVALALCAGTAAAADAAPEPPGPEAQSLAALRVVTLTEHIAKLQSQAGQAILAERARRALSQALRRFDAAVRALERPAAPLELHESVAIVGLLAKEYRVWAAKPATRDNARGLGERADELAWEAAKAARLHAPGDPGPAARAEEAAALAQRAARYAFWRHWQLGGSTARELASATARLHADLEALHAVPATAESDAELQLADNQAQFLFAALDDPAGDAHALETIAKAADNLQESMERLAALHAAR
jgi:hypothetical protein